MSSVRRTVALAVLTAAGAAGQCAMCYRNAQALGAARGRVFNLGIVVLGTPPLLILTGFALLLRRKNHR